MLRQLRASDSRFKTIAFSEGLNLLVADKTADSSQTDSRNGVGKSAMIELLHLLLGARVDRNSFVSKAELQPTVFSLEMEWPGVSEPLVISRCPETQNEITVSPDIGNAIAQSSSNSLTNAEWQSIIERDLFNLPAEHVGVSGRAMLALYMRRVASGAFNTPVKTSPQQSPAEASANIAYLLGLDWMLAARYRDLAAKESTRRQLSKAVKDPVWGRIVGRSSDLRGQMNLAHQRVSALESQIANFQVVPEYERLQRRADEIDQNIRQTRLQDAVDRRNLQDLERSLEDVSDPDIDYLESVYSELGVVIPQGVVRRFDEVREFHASVVSNRKEYLDAEITATRERLASRARERSELGEEQASLLRTLNEGGALDALTALQESLAYEKATLEALRNRFEAAQTLEESKAEIKAERSRLESEVRTDLRERNQIVDDINVRFLRYANRLYGSEREAYVEIAPAPSYLKIVPHIDSKDSRGIGNMVMFCFDLTVAVTAYRAGRGPGFLVHDSHLFDGVDERQVAQALRLAKDVAAEEGIQYIATINSDDLAKANNAGIDFSDSIIEPRLTDEYADGGLFGFRFA